ncbi:hypothetical protein [Pseudoduganella violacea]|uniref:Uncharacterized protein n=1 Tax=Pseudoduganella violacea TaxID=1715466 RepID=A0A7W5BA64_9BURK|nr:hypothetical protein [Pseudoduganella violacea]MBB3119156.1 hypothetical protein [Pseudoduganella violacea]
MQERDRKMKYGGRGTAGIVDGGGWRWVAVDGGGRRHGGGGGIDARKAEPEPLPWPVTTALFRRAGSQALAIHLDALRLVTEVPARLEFPIALLAIHAGNRQRSGQCGSGSEDENGNFFHSTLVLWTKS